MPKYRHYCECGREIKVRTHGKMAHPATDGHTQCRQCQQSLRDSFRNR